MRILLVNVNTTTSITDTMVKEAAAVASNGTEIVGLTPFFGPESVEGNFESYLSAVAVMDRVLAYDGPYDAVVQAGFGEHGREGLQELLDVPVVDITEASAHVATMLGRTFSVITTLDRAIPQIEDRLRIGGLLARCASIRASGITVLDVERDTARAVDALVRQAHVALTSDGAEVICLGCGGMAGLREEVQGQTAAPVVDAVASGVAIAEALVRLGLKTSKIRSFAPPNPKILRGWPLPRPSQT